MRTRLKRLRKRIPWSESPIMWTREFSISVSYVRFQKNSSHVSFSAFRMRSTWRKTPIRHWSACRVFKQDSLLQGIGGTAVRGRGGGKRFHCRIFRNRGQLHMVSNAFLGYTTIVNANTHCTRASKNILFFARQKTWEIVLFCFHCKFLCFLPVTQETESISSSGLGCPVGLVGVHRPRSADRRQPLFRWSQS